MFSETHATTAAMRNLRLLRVTLQPSRARERSTKRGNKNTLDARAVLAITRARDVVLSSVARR
jgi:hypothetical protein